MSSVLSDCLECKHCQGYDKLKNGIICDVFPNGIPAEILFDEAGARQLPECNNNIRFEPIEDKPTQR